MMLRSCALGLFGYKRDAAVVAASPLITDEEWALINMRTAHVLRHSTCPDCTGPLVTSRGESRTVRDNGWFTYKCADAACAANAHGWAYHFLPGAVKRLSSGEPLPLRPETDWTTGRTAFDLARDTMLETERCPLCKADLAVKDADGGWSNHCAAPTSYTCAAEGCGMQWLVHPEAIRSHLKKLAQGIADIPSKLLGHPPRPRPARTPAPEESEPS